MPCSTGESSSSGRPMYGVKRSRRPGASRSTPCSSVLNHCASASEKSSASRRCASISPASCVPSPPRSSQAYTPCSANSRARRRALRALARACAALSAAVVFFVVKIFVLVFVVFFGLERRHRGGHLDGRLGAVAALARGAGLRLLVMIDGQDVYGHRNAVFQRNAGNRPRHLVADHLEMLGPAAVDRTQGDERVEFEGFGHVR